MAAPRRQPGHVGACPARRRGLSRLEIIAILAAIAALTSVAWIVLAKARIQALAQYDVSALRHVHAGFLTEAGIRGQGGVLPLPSLLMRRSLDQPEDFTLNHTANIYSMMVMQEYFAPELLVSPLETAPYVRAATPDFAAYNPTAGVYWDPSFVMRIDDPAIGANGSYVHVVAVGDRRHPTGGAAFPVLANRSPPPWASPGQPEFDRSPTLRSFGGSKHWSGNVCFMDNHIEQLVSYYWPIVPRDPPGGTLAPDNIFAADFDHPNGPQAAGDAFLAIYIAATEFTVQPVYDPPQ